MFLFLFGLCFSLVSYVCKPYRIPELPILNKLVYGYSIYHCHLICSYRNCCQILFPLIFCTLRQNQIFSPSKRNLGFVTLVAAVGYQTGWRNLRHSGQMRRQLSHGLMHLRLASYVITLTRMTKSAIGVKPW